MAKKVSQEQRETNSSWKQYKIRGKMFDRIRVGKDRFLTECSHCLSRSGHLHQLGCQVETSPCGFCKAEFSVDCLCPYHEEEDE